MTAVSCAARFEHDMHGVVDYERRNANVPNSFKGLHFPATDIPMQTRDNFFMMGHRLIASVNAVSSPLFMSNGVDMPNLQLINLRSIHPCHQAYLQVGQAPFR